MSKIEATVVADSINPQKDRLTSVLVTMPRIILSEMNTHRMLSKNTSSSRAIPFKKMVEAVQNNPFIPIAWQKEHKGMQGNEYITSDYDIAMAQTRWLRARGEAINNAQILNSEVIGVTKQLCNRLLEPFMWTTMLITGSKEGWDNFFSLRSPSYEIGVNKFKSKKDVLDYYSDEPNYIELKNYTDLDWLQLNKGQAEIHMMALAEEIYDAMNESTPKQLKAGEWHIPFYDQITDLLVDELGDDEAAFIPDEKVAKISVAMAAHTSYTVVGGEVVKSSEKWLELHDKLLSYDPPHSSPMEHCCVCVTDEDYNKSFKGEEKGWFRNYKGFKSYRQIIEESK